MIQAFSRHHPQLSTQCLQQLATHKNLKNLMLVPVSVALRPGLDAILDQCNLEALALSDEDPESAVSSDVLSRFIQRQKETLTHFWYYPFGSVTKEHLIQLAECKKLTALAVRLAPEVTFQDLQHVISHRSNLEMLFLRNPLSSQELISLTPHLSKLRDFSFFILTGELAIDPDLRGKLPSMNAVLTFVDRCPSLQLCSFSHFTKEQKQVLKQLRPHVKFD